MAKKKLTLSMEEENIKQLKKIAIDKGVTVSDYLYNSAVTISRIKPEELKRISKTEQDN